jgi:cytochrome c oxidase assembly protein subunit 15
MSSTATSRPRAVSAVGSSGEATHARALRIWLGAIALLIVAMILVGGATRLTDSGLSITEWKPIMGAIPPLSEADWQQAFQAYRQIPEYAQVNPTMDLTAFKAIYWWEWTHRFLGRLIGVVFLVPFLVFWWAGYISRGLLPKLAGLFALGGLQGAVGWYMVKSGLVDRIDVSQYRLAVHFGIAVLILGATLWLWFGLGAETKENSRRPRYALSVAVLVLTLVYVQMLAGALVAGLDAGLGFNTWPLMNGAFVPDGLGAATPWYLNLFENPLTVQFDHRMLGYVVLAATLAQAGWLTLRGGSLALSGMAVACIALLQVTLGVWTLLLAVPIELGLGHQAGAIALFIASLHHLWLVSDLSPKSQTVARA